MHIGQPFRRWKPDVTGDFHLRQPQEEKSDQGNNQKMRTQRYNEVQNQLASESSRFTLRFIEVEEMADSDEISLILEALSKEQDDVRDQSGQGQWQ